MEKGQTYEIIIEDMSSEGQGIGRIATPDGGSLVVFAAGGVPGDRLQVHLTKVKKNYAFAQIDEVLECSPHRVEALTCSGYGQGCGGCPFAVLDYEAQLQIKEHQVRNKLMRLAGIADPYVRPIIGMLPEDNGGMGVFRYRNKAQFPVSTGGIITRKGGIVENLGDPAVGFYRAKSHDVVDCEDCYLQSMPAMAAADALRTFMVEDNITAFDPKWEKGLLRHLIVKTAFQTREVMVILVVNGKGIPNAPKLIGMLDDAIYETGYQLESVVLNVNKASGKHVEKNKHKDRRDIAISGEIMGDENIVIAGKPTITDQMGALRFEISPASFYQVNPVQMRRLYDQVRAYVRVAGADASADATADDAEEKPSRPVILDLYCGVGSIGLTCADLAEMVIGVESVKDAVVDANRNAVINGIVNARYICGKAEHVLPAYMDMLSKNERSGRKNNQSGKDAPSERAGKVKIDPQLQEYIQRADIAILDPPRAGCRPELLQAVADTGVSSIIYVSCDPATLARDVKLITELGFCFEEATPVDMFPHTGHVETVVLMSRVKD